MKYLNRFRVHPGDKVHLKDIDPGFKDHHEGHKKAAEEIDRDRERLRALQALLYADGRCSLLICLQGLDAGGKDGDYMAAYEEALSRCSTNHAPWFVVPSDHKWFRNLVIARIVVEHLEALDMKVPEPSVDLKKIRREYHAAKAKSK